jgi:hypothetical protein
VVAHFLDLGGNRNVSLPELEEALVQGGAIEAEVGVVWGVYSFIGRLCRKRGGKVERKRRKRGGE